MHAMTSSVPVSPAAFRASLFADDHAYYDMEEAHLALYGALAGPEATPSIIAYLSDLQQLRQVLADRAAAWTGNAQPKRAFTIYLNSMAEDHWFIRNVMADPGLLWVIDICQEIRASKEKVVNRTIGLTGATYIRDTPLDGQIQCAGSCRNTYDPRDHEPDSGSIREPLFGHQP